jgi:hypothetical protein
MPPMRRREPCRHRHVAQSAALRDRDVTAPLGSLDAELPFGQIDIAPLERDDLPAPQTRLAAQEHDQVRVPIQRFRSPHQLLILVEVIKAH